MKEETKFLQLQINSLKAETERLSCSIIILSKRITQLQEQKVDRPCQ